MSNQQVYRRPPITEGVIEVQFGNELSLNDLDRLKNKLSPNYPKVEQRAGITFQVENGVPKAPSVSEIEQYVITNSMGNASVILGRRSFGSARLSPYPGWEKLIGEARANFETLEKLLGRRTITRLGTRFINRIDIPKAALVGVPLSSYVRFGPAIPSSIQHRVSGYAMNVALVEASHGFQVILNSNIDPNVVIDRVSFILDVDVSQSSNLPLRAEEVWKAFEDLRAVKNHIFESCVTDTARELFR